MVAQDRLLEENAALVALLTTIDEHRDTWSSVANTVARQGSAVAVLDHEMDPVHHHLIDDDPLYDGDPALFDEDDVPPTAERRHALDKALQSARREVQEWHGRDLDFVSVLDGRYPNRLRQIADMPPFLFADGAMVQDELAVSVVGSREASSEALGFARDTASMLVACRFAVIAGLAAGIDTAAHEQALAEDGRTVAFIGTGITRQYPRQNEALQREIARRGLVLSQFWPDQGPTKTTFPMRNASMSGYGIATVVVEANEYSGTRIQARQAQQHGRPVILRDTVAASTEWGRRLAGRPGVYVASTVSQVHDILLRLLHLGDELDHAIDQLVSSTATA
ncbi:DNA-binding protein [Bifidobacterium sp. UTCIF-37]|uniref:DNA-processing protein DprA n=1 Tax=unclassified Bifidobacterium TaxID=2608897 RepID=UPI001127A70E|nr:MULTISPECIES: DNA-processing protein DprA [unclassified Bifidobacterium]TPF86512.1 DNA-binding protein [Bifidobacterium sp. UTCIF-37]TPF89462.1 DNA-binding protein [Bifidobacterium sp. UTCIF-38]